MVNIFQRYILVFLSKAKRALFKPFQLRARALSLSLSLSLSPSLSLSLSLSPSLSLSLSLSLALFGRAPVSCRILHPARLCIP